MFAKYKKQRDQGRSLVKRDFICDQTVWQGIVGWYGEMIHRSNICNDLESIGKPIWGIQRILILALKKRKYAVKTDKNFGSWFLASETTALSCCE